MLRLVLLIESPAESEMVSGFWGAMYTKQELTEIRDRAEQEAGSESNNLLWRSACLDLSKAAERLDSIHDRICKSEMTALKGGWPKPQPPISECKSSTSPQPK